LTRPTTSISKPSCKLSQQCSEGGRAEVRERQADQPGAPDGDIRRQRAGEGWSLEVFPGGFVVHRKYGIGRYEQTVLKPKARLTEEEREAAEERRKGRIGELTREGMQLEEI